MIDNSPPRGVGRKGRGAASNATSRFNERQYEPFDDGWNDADPAEISIPTTVTSEVARSIITQNRSPDIPFDYSLNAYRGCEHGCIYCYARPSHAYLGLSPGLDFETKLYAKDNAASVLRAELSRKSYQCRPIALGANTDPYQPIERERRLTRQVLEVLSAFKHPVTITTKSALIERDIDLLRSMAEAHLAQVQISLTTLDRSLARVLEPRAAAPQRRLRVIERLADAGICVTVMIAPVIPILTDSELERLLQAAADAGASSAEYILLRLPLELKELIGEWLSEHAALKKNHVLQVLEACHGGRLYDSQFGTRQRGTGPFAELLEQRFKLAVRRAGLVLREEVTLDCSQFRVPRQGPIQPSLFDDWPPT